MTLTVTISVPANNGPYEALITHAGKPDTILVPGESVDIIIWHGGPGPAVSEVPAGTKAARNAEVAQLAQSVEGLAGAAAEGLDARRSSFSGYLTTGPAHVKLDLDSDKPLPTDQACDLSGEGGCTACE